jgi:hypothetical protein
LGRFKQETAATMINTILDMIKGEYGPLTYNSIHTLVRQWPQEIVDRLNYDHVASLAQHIAYVIGEV